MRKSRRVQQRLSLRKSIPYYPRKIHSVKMLRAAIIVERQRCKASFPKKILSETPLIKDMAKAKAISTLPRRDKIRNYKVLL